MTRARKPSEVIADYRNIQHTAHDFRLSDQDQRAIKELVDRYTADSDNRRTAESAITLAINMARKQSNMAKISQAEYQAIYREQARRAADMLEFVTTQFDGERFSAGSEFYSALVHEGIEENTFEAYQDDPLFKHRRLLGELLTLINQRSTAIADRIEPAAYQRNEAHHVLAQHLMDAAKAGKLPVTPSASKTSRMAGLFSEAAQIAGLEPGDPAKYLEGK